MERVDGSDRYDDGLSNEQSPSLLTVILDTNPAAWALISNTLPLSKAVADLLVFLNAHLACNYANKVAVIASHCDRAHWLYPTPKEQKPVSGGNAPPQKPDLHTSSTDDQAPSSTKRARHNDTDGHKTSSNTEPGNFAPFETNKYRPFRLVEEELTRNLQTLVSSTKPSTISAGSSTKIAGALTLALTYINRESVAYNESTTGTTPHLADQSTTLANTADGSASGNLRTNPLQARIFLLNLSPSTDLAHQYIPIMNSIFACQRLNIPIDVLQLPLPLSNNTNNARTRPDPTGSSAESQNGITRESQSTTSTSTVFLQQAADATHGIFIPAILSPSSVPSATTKSGSTHADDAPPTTTTQKQSLATSALLTYLLTAFLPTPQTRRHTILPTRIDVDFRAACFCHRNVISIGFVCSICLSIFCSVPEGGECLTCGTVLGVGDYGGRPIVDKIFSKGLR